MENKYKFEKVLTAGAIIHINGIPVEVLHDTKVGSNTNFEENELELQDNKITI